MLSKVCTAALTGIDAYPVAVETDLSRGLPAIYTVGLPSTTVKEAKERVRSAIINSGFDFPVKRITINLSPAASRKDGSHFDLPLAIGMLVSNGEIAQHRVSNVGFLGELSLDGKLIGIKGALPLCIGLRDSGMEYIVVPRENADEAALVDAVKIVPADTLTAVVEALQGKQSLHIYNRKEKPGSIIESELDFADVKGQFAAKRAILTAVAGGGHGLYMIGSPGAGKTMLASRIPTIMPELSYEEMLELTKIYSISGMLSEMESVICERPFRMPYHSATIPALLGGGRIPKPGEISLAHKGVLFLDEFPEFDRKVIELLRKPIETGKISIERNEEHVVFPAQFMLVAAGNPCKCGYYGDPERECKCSGSELRNYQMKLSGPIIDRIDIQIKVEKAKIEELQGKPDQEETSYDNPYTSQLLTSESMREAVRGALMIQNERYRNEPPDMRVNARLSGRNINKYCHLNSDCRKLLAEAYRKMGLSARAYEKIIKVSRTIADLEGAEEIQEYHIAEAIQYRILDRMYE